jgi:hypothetical protein
MGLGIKRKLRRGLMFASGAVRSVGKQKIFCVGCNKTGTTSLEVALRELGYIMGDQATAELLTIQYWGKRDFRRIIRYCYTAQAFQDVPFSKPYTYQALDMAFPNSKFILTVRDSSDQWYNSITRFHAKMWEKNGRIPTKKDLQQASYRYKGMAWDANRLSYTSPEDDPYRKADLVAYYERHNAAVIEYYRHRPGDLLVLNVAE